MSRPLRPTATAVLLVASLAAGGCMLLRAKQDQEQIATYGRITGTVRTEHESKSPMIVVLLSESFRGEEGARKVEIVDHFIREQAGSYAFTAKPGRYDVVAFEDVNADGNFDPDEPLLDPRAAGQPQVEVVAGESTERNLVIPTAGRAGQAVQDPVDIAALQARSQLDQVARSIGSLLVRGDVVDLADERFGAANGTLGLWQPLNFVIQVGAGIYLTEPYDPDRIPILFVHGISGYPQEFTALIDSLDHDRFQAWFFYYPSGLRLDAIARRGAELMVELQIRYGFRDFAVVAHSMGGLVAREFVFHHASQTGREDIPLFVTISTPWAGDSRAIKGVEDSPIVVESWRDMASNSEFLKQLFWTGDPAEPRRLPERVAWHMLFSVRGASRGDVSTDGTVAVASQLRHEAQHEVRSQLGVDNSHTGILESDEARERLNELLAATFD